MEKVGSLLAELSGQMPSFQYPAGHATSLETEPLPINWNTPKISRGENYKGLPWVVLDYPRAFGREDVLAIRTLFWWGHYFSVTLHLKGKYMALFLPVIRKHAALLADNGFHIGTSEDEWRHELDSDNYQPMREDMDITDLETRIFLKLSAKCTLDRWDEAGSVLLGLYNVLIRVLQDECG